MERRRLPSAKPPAPVFEVAPRQVVAVEHPAIIKNLDNAVKTFGRNNPFERILNSVDPEECVPLYLRFNDPTCAPILSHNSATNNVLLKITVPKRTGRKRKRGSQDPYTDDGGPGISPRGDDVADESDLRSHSRMDHATSIVRKLKDNVGNYTVEAVAKVRQTHRFRGLADFHQSTSHSKFFSRLRDTALTGDITKMREFKFDPSRGWKPNEEILPPPSMTPHTLSFNWAWLQNPNIEEEVDPVTGKAVLTNNSKLKRPKMEYLDRNTEKIPAGPSIKIPDDGEVRELINELTVVFNERPVWTRRAVINRLSNSPRLHLIKQAIPYVAYRLKGGPFRDAIVKYGVDPRKDKKYRNYQTVFFQIWETELREIGTPWHDVRTEISLSKRNRTIADDKSHLFDGNVLTVDGKIWQMCDVTDPLLAKLIRDSPVRQEYEPETDGWFCNGTLAKIKAIMKVKVMALRYGKELKDEDFRAALAAPDDVPDRPSKQVPVQVPNMSLSTAEMRKLRESGGEWTVSSLYKPGRPPRKGYIGPLRNRVDKATGERRQSTGSDSKTPDGDVGAPGRKQRDGSIDPRLLADQNDNQVSRIGDSGGIDDQDEGFRGYIDNQVGAYEGYDSDIDDEDSERDEYDSDRSQDAEDEDSEMEAEDGEDLEEGGSEADSIDFVQYHDSQPTQSVDEFGQPLAPQPS